jgi:DNA-binding CsgD family transcriptional regulator
MQQIWPIQAQGKHSVSTQCAAHLLTAVNASQPLEHMLSAVNEVAAVDYISLLSHEKAASHLAPRFEAGCSRAPGIANVTALCFDLYRQRYWQADTLQHRAIEQASQGADSDVMASHMRTQDIPLPGWREEIYQRQHLADRLSFTYALSGSSIYTINLYRSSSVGVLRDQDLQQLLPLAMLLRQTHAQALHRHFDGSGDTKVASIHQAAHQGDLASIFTQQLARLAPMLSAREKLVCSLIAQGVSADGIAVHLCVAPSTVITLRRRAYAKLAQQGLYGGRIALIKLISSIGKTAA